MSVYSEDFSKTSKKLLDAKKKLEEKLLLSTFKQALKAESGTKQYGFENIVGVGISEKLIDHLFTGKQSVTVYVTQKVAKDQVLKQALVPDEINGLPTDVVAIGEVNALSYKGVYRPATGGVSIGHFQITAGTLGCLVNKGGQHYILSNNHVIANSNNAVVGDPILQPGPYDGGNTGQHTIARLSEFVPVRFDGVPNLVDAAIARSTPPVVSPLNIAFGKISSTPVLAERYQIVKKAGRTTEVTRGLVIDTNATIRVGYGSSGQAIFSNQIIAISVPLFPFSQGGDSGSLVLTQFGNNPVGLLFAGSQTHTIINPIQNVLNAFGVQIAT